MLYLCTRKYKLCVDLTEKSEFGKLFSCMVYQNHIFTLEDGVVKILGVYIGIPKEKLMLVLLEQGFTIDDNSSIPSVFKGNIQGLGICSLSIREANNKVGSIVICTEREYSEKEALVVFEQVKDDLHMEPSFDYNGFGISPNPHEIDHFWDLSEGLVKIQWDGFNTHNFSFRNNDGLDHISFCLQGPIVKDEEYWRSEVD